MTLTRAAAGVVEASVCGRTYNIGFNGGDETQFEARNLKELRECWNGFCKDEKIPGNCVDYIERVN